MGLSRMGLIVPRALRRAGWVVAPLAAIALLGGAAAGSRAGGAMPTAAATPSRSLGAVPTAAATPSRSPGATVLAGGIAIRRPPGWQLLAPPVTALSSPSDRLLLTSYATKRGGNCAPDRALRDLPAGGALAYLFEYRLSRGAVWKHVRRRDFPTRPAHFTLRRAALGHYECWRHPSYLIRFRAADRPFQLHVALGARATAARRALLLRALDSLRFEPLPTPPPDPYEGWRLLTDETGDSIRTPPGWPAAATTSPRRFGRPRALFFASNERMPGLAPAAPRSRRVSRRLPSPFPEAALDAFPAGGVLLWFLEHAKGPASPEFPAVARSWPQPQEFAVRATGPASRWPQLRWERAAISARGGHRFSVWIVSGSAAGDADRALARKSAAALALSTGSHRDARCRRACLTG